MLPARIFSACLAAILVSAAGMGFAGAEDDAIVLGAAVSLSGRYAPNGANTKNGYELAIRKINGKGGVNLRGKNYKLVLRYYDDESEPARSAELAERLIQQDGAKFMLGPYSSSVTKAMLPVVEKYKVPMIQANGAARELFTKGYRYMFAVLSTSDQYLAPAIDLAAEHAAKLGKTPDKITVALAMQDEPFAQDVRAGVLAQVTRHRMRVVIDDQLPPDFADISATLKKIEALKPDLLLISGSERGAHLAVTQIKAVRVYIPMIAMTHCDSARIAERLGEAAEHVFCAHQWHRSLGYRDDVFGTAEDFARAFQEAYRYEPPYQAAQSAAAVGVFAAAFERAQTLDTEAVRNAIGAMDMETFYGPVKFDGAGRNVAKPIVLTQIQRGKYVVVAPKKWAAGSPVVPRAR